jgi:hypothetical protein
MRLTTFSYIFVEPPERPPIILDADETDDPIHGNSGGTVLSRLPWPLSLSAVVHFAESFSSTPLRRSDIDASSGLDELKQIVAADLSQVGEGDNPPESRFGILP